MLYPGDYEVSHGAATLARAVAAIVRKVPAARVVFACRAKTPKSAIARAAVENDLRAAGLLDRTRHAGEVDDMAALIAASSVVAFPVDDLYGKVDVPLVLLEALALGVPIVAARGGPLEALSTARFVDPDDDQPLAAELTRFLLDPGASAPSPPPAGGPAPRRLRRPLLPAGRRRGVRRSLRASSAAPDSAR